MNSASFYVASYISRYNHKYSLNVSVDIRILQRYTYISSDDKKMLTLLFRFFFTFNDLIRENKWEISS